MSLKRDSLCSSKGQRRPWEAWRSQQGRGEGERKSERREEEVGVVDGTLPTPVHKNLCCPVFPLVKSENWT